MLFPIALLETTKDASYKLFHPDAQHKDGQKKHEITLLTYSLTTAIFFVGASTLFVQQFQTKLGRFHRIVVVVFLLFRLSFVVLHHFQCFEQ